MVKILIVCLLLAVPIASLPASMSANDMPKVTTQAAATKAVELPAYLKAILPPKILLPPNQQGQLSSEMCKAVWSVDGTICQPKKVLNYLATTNKLKSLDSKSVESGEATSGPVKRRLLPSLTASATSAVPNQNQPISNLINDHPAENLKFDQKVFEPLMTFDFTKFTGYMNTCWKYLSHARNVSMCYACSQHNTRYFQKGKAIVTQQDCRNMLSSCLPFFRTVAAYIKDAHFALVEFQSAATATPQSTPTSPLAAGAVTSFSNTPASGNGPASNGGTKKPSQPLNQGGKSEQVGFSSNWAKVLTEDQNKILNSLYSSMVKVKLLDQINEYDSSTVATTKNKCGNSLCLKLFRLYISPIFELIGKMVESVKKEVDSITKPSKAIQTNAPRFLSPDDEQGLHNPFEGDVAILFTDPAGHIWVQSSDNVINSVANGEKQAMNFSMAFP